MELYWPATLYPSASEVTVKDGSGRFVSPFTGTTRTVSRPGATRLQLSMSFTGLRGAKRGALKSLLTGLGGAEGRVWIRDFSYTQRGSFPTSEVFTNNDFSSGTTGWTGQNATVTAADGVLRVTPSSIGTNRAVYQNTTATQYAPYVLRSAIVDGAQTSGLSVGRFSYYASGVSSQDPSTTARGYGAIASVRLDASALAQYPAVIFSSSGYTTDAYLAVQWASYSRCALADNAPNLLLQSQDFTTTWANTRSSDAANSAAAPDGTTTADSLIEDGTASNTHYVSQGVTVSSAAAEYSFSVSLKAGTRTFARVYMQESTSSHGCYVDVNLSTGALGTATASGANWTNPRAFVVSQGSSWYRVTIVGRKASAGTTLTAQIYLASALGTTSYSGDGASLIYAWGASLAQSSVPVKYTATTTTAASAASQTGNALNVKGLPASTSGLLLPGDQFQVGDELKIVTASLDSDAAGLGYLQFAPSLRESPADSDPVIIHQPAGKFLLAEQENSWQNALADFAASELRFIEAVD